MADPQPVKLPRWLRWFLDKAPNWLKPDLTTEPRPDDPVLSRYVRSFMWSRIFIGLLAIALPFLLVLLDWAFFDGDPAPRDSLSAYFWSDAREWFVGVLCAIGVFLLTYKLTETSLDNTLSIVAAVFVLLVVFFPTGSALPDNAIQEKLGEDWVTGFHAFAAGVFIGSLALISLCYGVREAARTQDGIAPPSFWKWFHWGCAIVIAAAIAAIGLDWMTGWGPRTTVLWMEALAVVAFGASWLTKGFDYKYLFQHK
ncbi:MAG TPA: hypothetical protein VHJ58_07800 [Vicinamibacterales bacterium]|jgi:hypothetical protein|nr:hypothetical protein [Vicinamibacterales bacterium]